MKKQMVELDIAESLSMIEYQSNSNKPLNDMVTFFYYSAKKLSSYYAREAQQKLDKSLFQRFIRQYQSYFVNRDLSRLNESLLETVRTTKFLIKGWNNKILDTKYQNSASSIVTFNHEVNSPKNKLQQQLGKSKINYQIIHSVKSLSNASENKLGKVGLKGISKKNQFMNPQTDNIKYSNNENHATKVSISPGVPRDVRRTISRNDETFIDNLNSLKHSIVSDRENLPKTKTNNLEQADRFQQLYSQIMKQYSEHKLDSAALLVTQTMKLIQLQKLNMEKYAIQKQQLDEILFEYNEMMNSYTNYSAPGWKLDKEDKGVKIYLNTTKNSQVGVMVDTQLNVDILNFFVISAEIDLFGQYIPFCYDCKQIRHISRNIILGTSKISLPIISDRQIFFTATVINRLDVNGSILIYSKTIHNDKRAQQKFSFQPPPVGKCVRFEYVFFMVECILLGKNKIRVRTASSVDMKLNFLPTFVISMAARKFAVETLMNMVKYQKIFNQTEWAKRKVAKREMYGYFQKLINEYLGRAC